MITTPNGCILELTMEFRLTYQGLLLSETTNRNKAAARATHKQKIRKVFHHQLKRLWSINPFLRGAWDDYSEKDKLVNISRPPREHSIKALSERFQIGDYNFVPLITSDMGVLCSIDVLFLRNDPPGSVFSAGDIDNRLKTLFDALTKPTGMGQLGEFQMPAEDETPFFCLLEDDSLITRTSVETDTLLDLVTNENDGINDARVIVTVKTSVYNLTKMGFGFL